MRPAPFANSSSVTDGIFAVVLLIFGFVAPRLFGFVFNSQFFDAEVNNGVRE